MSKCCIAFGRCSYLYFYLLIAIISNTIKRLITGSKTIVLNNYYLIQAIYKYFGEIILGALFYFILNRFLKEKKNTTMSRKNTKTSLIFNKKMVDISKIDIVTIIIACSFYALYVIIIKIINFYQFNSLIFWTAHLSFVLLFTNKYFPQNLYKHQIYSMIIVIIIDSILILMSTFLNFQKNNNIYEVKGVGICIFVIFFYIFITCFYSFSEIKIKAIMDFKYFSPYSIIILIGAFGFVFSFSAAILFSIFGKKCNKELKTDINCFGEVLSYFKVLKSKLENDSANFYLEVIIITPLYIISEFAQVTSFIFIIKYLNPIYSLLADNIYFTGYNIAYFFIKKNYYNKQRTIKFLFSEISEILEFLGFIIYLEIIELRFCGLNRNTRKNIALRGESEFIQRISSNTVNDEDYYEEENDKDKEIELALN